MNSLTGFRYAIEVIDKEGILMGKLYVIESGTDCSGKATQTQKLYDRLFYEGFNVKKVEYPNYKSDSSALVKMYLSGQFGTDPNAVNPYAGSTFYAVDRFASYKKEWEEFYQKGGIIIADRYTTSNMIHQAGKISDIQKKEDYLDWLWDLEFVKMQLPVPNKVIFLDVAPEVSAKLMKDRKNKFDENAPKDIHERNQQHLLDAYQNAQFVANKYHWCKINCVEGQQMKTVEDIHEMIYQAIIQDIQN